MLSDPYIDLREAPFSVVANDSSPAVVTQSTAWAIAKRCSPQAQQSHQLGLPTMLRFAGSRLCGTLGGVTHLMNGLYT